MAGLFAALSLRDRGFDVEIFERAGDELANRGAGIATHRPLYDAVRSAGIELLDEMGVESAGRVLFDTAGSVRATFDAPQLMTSWGLIYRFLRAQFPDASYHHGHALVGLEAAGESVDAYFENGATVRADWLIGADGSRSTVRQLVAPRVSFDYCGYFVWRGLLEEKWIDASAKDAIAQRMALNMAPGGHWLGYLVAGADDAMGPGERRFNWGWYRSADEALYRDHLTDVDGVFHEHGIPHGLLRTKWVEAMREEARRYLAPQIQSIIDATSQPFLQGIYDLASDRLIYERVVVIGDAAFTARPHVGLGVSKAAGDAATLAAALDDPAAMTKWEHERLAYGLASVEWGRDLGSYCGPAPANDARRAVAARHQRPEVLLAETAATDPAPYLARYLPGTARG